MYTFIVICKLLEGKMYTLKEVTSILEVSKVTVYRHMEKNSIEKGKKLSEDELALLKNSIQKGKVKSKGNMYTSKPVTFTKTEEYTLLKEEHEKLKKAFNKLKQENQRLEEKIAYMEKDNRELISQMQNSQIMSNELIAQNIELVRETRLLLAPKQKELKEEHIIPIKEQETITEINVSEKTPPKQKKWWRR